MQQFMILKNKIMKSIINKIKTFFLRMLIWIKFEKVQDVINFDNSYYMRHRATKEEVKKNFMDMIYLKYRD